MLNLSTWYYKNPFLYKCYELILKWIFLNHIQKSIYQLKIYDSQLAFDKANKNFYVTNAPKILQNSWTKKEHCDIDFYLQSALIQYTSNLGGGKSTQMGTILNMQKKYEN